MYRYICLGLIGILGSVNMAFGQGIFEESGLASDENSAKAIEWSGYTRGSVWGGSKQYDFSNVFAEFCLRAELSHGKAYLFTDLRFRKGLAYAEKYTAFQIKEAYAGYRSDKFDLFLGNQIVNWGRTDGFNPTNNISARDYFFLTADPEDQKLPGFMLRMKYQFNPFVDIELIGMPLYTASNYRFDLFYTAKGIHFTEPKLPENTVNNGTVAMRINFEYPGIGFSISWFNGFDPFYGFDVSTIDFTTGIPKVENRATPYRKNVLGVDVSIPLTSWIIRGEAAYSFTEDFEAFMFIPNPDIAYVLAVEYNFWGITSIFQYVGKYTFDFTTLPLPYLVNPDDPASQIQYAGQMILYESTLFNRKAFFQQKKSNHALVLSFIKAVPRNNLNTEITAYYNITSKEWMLRPKISWKMDDALIASLGGNYFSGPEKTIFDYSGKVLNGVFLELKALF